MINLLSANALNLDLSKILLFGKELKNAFVFFYRPHTTNLNSSLILPQILPSGTLMLMEAQGRCLLEYLSMMLNQQTRHIL